MTSYGRWWSKVEVGSTYCEFGLDTGKVGGDWLVGVVIARRVIDLDFWQFGEGTGRIEDRLDREDGLRIVRFLVGVGWDSLNLAINSPSVSEAAV
jgi:hypothetical protein